jgi:hypothetical protein
MSKRRTIGENPLEAVVSGNALDAVVPGPRGFRAGGSEAAPRDDDPALAQRLEQLEAALGKLKVQMSELRMELGEIKTQMFRDSWWIARLKEKLKDK